MLHWTMNISTEIRKSNSFDDWNHMTFHAALMCKLKSLFLTLVIWSLLIITQLFALFFFNFRFASSNFSFHALFNHSTTEQFFNTWEQKNKTNLFDMRYLFSILYWISKFFWKTECSLVLNFRIEIYSIFIFKSVPRFTAWTDCSFSQAPNYWIDRKHEYGCWAPIETHT